jgi:hypothetical protein
MTALNAALLYSSQAQLLLRRRRGASRDSRMVEYLSELIDVLNMVRQGLIRLGAGGAR